MIHLKKPNRMKRKLYLVLLSFLAVGHYSEAFSRETLRTPGDSHQRNHVHNLASEHLKQQTVSGVVTDAATGETMPGVTVTVKGTSEVLKPMPTELTASRPVSVKSSQPAPSATKP